jgi:hypothetical protein
MWASWGLSDSSRPPPSPVCVARINMQWETGDGQSIMSTPLHGRPGRAQAWNAVCCRMGQTWNCRMADQAEQSLSVHSIAWCTGPWAALACPQSQGGQGWEPWHGDWARQSIAVHSLAWQTGPGTALMDWGHVYCYTSLSLFSLLLWVESLFLPPTHTITTCLRDIGEA